MLTRTSQNAKLEHTHVISRRVLADFWRAHPDAQEPLAVWYQVAASVSWRSLSDVRATYPQADPVERLTVFNIGGNKYRLVAAVHYRGKRIYVRFIGTHRDYEKIDARTV